MNDSEVGRSARSARSFDGRGIDARGWTEREGARALASVARERRARGLDRFNLDWRAGYFFLFRFDAGGGATWARERGASVAAWVREMTKRVRERAGKASPEGGAVVTGDESTGMGMGTTSTGRGGLSDAEGAAVLETFVTANALDLGNAFVDTPREAGSVRRRVEEVPTRQETSANECDIEPAANDASMSGEPDSHQYAVSQSDGCDSPNPYGPGTLLDPDMDFSAVRHVIPLVVRERMEVEDEPSRIDPGLVQFCRGCRRTMTTAIHFTSNNKTCRQCLERQRLKRKNAAARRR